jgi:hypothetical protein
MKVLKDLAVSGSITVGQFLQSSINTDKFLVSESGVVKYRSGSQLLGDIGAAGSGHTHTFASLTSKPTTLSGYGITDAALSATTITINGTTYDLTADRSWTLSSYPAARNEYTFIASAGQTAFTANYTVGQVDVYYNGSKLIPSVYTASSGTSITLGFACKLNDEINVVAYLTGAGLNSNRTLTINGTTYDLTADRTWTLTTANISEVTNLYYTDARVLSYLTANTYATQSYVGTQVANLVAAAPATLDTLNELAAALGNDPSFATTVSTSIGTKVPQTRTLTINGTAYDLTADRSWTITSMIYPAAGIALSTGTAWGTSITDNSANWNTAYTDRNKWDGGATALVAATGRTSLGLVIGTDVLAYRTFGTAANSATGDFATAAHTHTSLQVTTALGFTPYNATNPNGYITSYTETDTLASVTNRGSSTAQNITFSNGRKGLIGVYDASQTQAIFAMGAAYILTDGGASATIGNLYGLAWSYNPDYGGAGNNPQSKAGLNHQLLHMQNGITTTAIGSGIWTSGTITTTVDVRAPIFYDSDTTYYLDMSSTSDTAGKIRGGILFGPNTTWGAYLRVGGNGDPDTSYANVAATNGNLHLDSKAGYAMYLNNYANGIIYLNGGTYYISANGSNYNGNAATATYATSAGSLSSMNISQFTNNTGYITSSGSISGYADRIQTGNNQWIWANGAHTATNPNSITLWDQYGSNGGAGYLTAYATIVDIYGRVSHEHDQLYFDSSGTIYHRNCFYGTNSWNGWRTMIDSSNIGSQSVSYASTAGSASSASTAGSVTGSSTISGYLTLASDWGVSPYTSALTIIGTYPSITLRNSTSDWEWLLHHDGAGDLQYYAGAGYTVNSWTQRYTFGRYGDFYLRTGSLTASGDITAYSDIRVKENIEVIKNALEKIQAIRGVTFNRTDLENDKGVRHAGVIAQEVLEVLPEVVKTNDKGMYSVAYGNITALLIEGVKEQQLLISSQRADIEELKIQINYILENK